MKGRFWRKALAAALALLIVSGGTPIQPLSQVIEDIAITASAESTITPVTPQLDSDGFYSIGSAAELYGFAELVNNGNATANAKLTADITVNENVLDANGEANTGDFVQWTPIGNDSFEGKVYSGTFDGQGHTISGLYVSSSGWYVGFIGKVSGSAVVKNLGIVDSYFSSSNNFLGSIVGGVSYNSSVTLANVYSTSTVKGDNWIGGLAGGGDGSFSFVNSYFAGKTSAGWSYGAHHDDLVSGSFNDFNSGTLNIVNIFVVGTSQYGTSVTAEQLSDGTVAAALHYYQDALADGSMFGINDGKTTFSGSLEGVSVTTADITLHTFDGDATAYSSKYVVGITTPLPVNVVREGYTFLGWYDNANFEGDAVTQISSSETGNKEYWAKFVRSHSVSFVLNGGTIQKGEIDHYIEGEATTLPTMVFKDGASFEGWYTTEDFTGSRYYSIPSTATEDMTFYAKWGAEKTTFYLQQGGSPEPVNVLYEGENVVYLDKTTMDGYNVRDEYRNYWGGFSGSVNVPYTGGESTFGNGGRAINVAQSGFYVFTLTDMGEGNWFVSVLRSLENCTISDIPEQTRTGSAIEPTLEITDGETTLTLGTDYTIEYSDNTNVGTASVTITGIGNYSGTITKTFAINKATPTVTAPTANTLTYNGGEQELVTAGSTDFGKVLYSLDGTSYSEEVPKGTSAGDYTVFYKVEGSDNWNAVAPQTVTAKIGYSDGIGAHLAGHSLSLTGNIGVNFYMELDANVIADEDAYMHFTLPNGKPQDVKIGQATTKTISGKTYYVFQCNVAAKEMTDTIKAQMFSGNKSGQVYEYTVKDYADYLFANAYEDDGMTVKNQSYVDAIPLVKAMLNYGSYSQTYFSHNTDAPANADITDTDVSTITAETVSKPYDSSTAILPSGITLEGANLALESETVLNLYFSNTTGKELTFTTSGNVTLDQKQDGTYTKVTITGIAAQYLDNDVTVNVIVAGDDTAYSVQYSPMNYCYNTLSRDTTTTRTEALKNVMRAFYLYNQEAKTYFTAHSN